MIKNIDVRKVNTVLTVDVLKEAFKDSKKASEALSWLISAFPNLDIAQDEALLCHLFKFQDKFSYHYVKFVGFCIKEGV